MALLGQADRTSKASSRSEISRWPVNAPRRINVNNDGVPSTRRLLASIAPRYGYWPHVLPVQVKQAPASLERTPIIDVCGGKILTTTQGLGIAPAAQRTGVPGHAVVSHWGFLASRTR